MTKLQSARRIIIEAGNPALPGATVTKTGINFSFCCEANQKCQLVLYRKRGQEQITTIEFTADMRFGNVVTVHVRGIRPENCEYSYFVDGKEVLDPYAVEIHGRVKWGMVQENTCKAVAAHRPFDWEGDKPLQIPLNETILYGLHVRGFTRDRTSKVRYKGTFAGIVEKIPYLKDLGITMIELMPAYDFDEVIPERKVFSTAGCEFHKKPRLNYWGYTKGNYFVPKSAYAYHEKDSVREFKEMVKALHQNQIEIGMEFSFPFETDPMFILHCVRYWVLEYHIDGIHLFASEETMNLLRRDPLLAATKIFSWKIEEKSQKEGYGNRQNMANFNDDFLVVARRFLKSDEGQVQNMANMLRYQPKIGSNVNYMANHATFTLYDMVSYDRKHNEENLEGNHDGPEYNYSWNCGEEGPSKKKRVMDLRRKQLKNALTFLFTAQGIPMIYAGDECGNSQNGNNNPYCQDNSVGWVNWKRNAFQMEILSYTKEMIAFRKQHHILHMREELKIMDDQAFGLPDISYHGYQPWYADFSYVNRCLGILLCGKYAVRDGWPEENNLYLAYNMYWEKQEFGLPETFEQEFWTIKMSTDYLTEEERKVADENIKERKLVVPPRSIIILESQKREKKHHRKNRRREKAKEECN